jgi:hypothetical protein
MDEFGGRRDIRGPYSRGFAITPSNNDLAFVTNAIFVTGTGNLVLQLVDNAPNDTITLPVANNQWVYVRARRVMAATTATGLIGFS